MSVSLAARSWLPSVWRAPAAVKRVRCTCPARNPRPGLQRRNQRTRPPTRPIRWTSRRNAELVFEAVYPGPQSFLVVAAIVKALPQQSVRQLKHIQRPSWPLGRQRSHTRQPSNKASRTA